jgi:hypothetical protein
VLSILKVSDTIPSNFKVHKNKDAIRIDYYTSYSSFEFEVLPNPYKTTDYQLCISKIKDGFPFGDQYYVPNVFVIGTLFAVHHQSNVPYNIQIFNRWGSLVWDQKNIITNIDGWTGEGEPEGVYTYKLSIENKIKWGTITLIVPQ